MKLLIRSGLLRNLGGILDSRLYTKSVLGTKDVIEEYLEEVCLTLDCLLADTKANPHTQRELFVEVSQSFGHTALLLHGGATFGLYHLGVVKALFEEGLLPKVISGSSVGALIAALVCIHTNDELPSLFVPGGIDLQAFASKNSTGSIRRKITRLLTKGYLLDVKVLEDCVQSNLGDITFLEAFEKTGMILNIVVSSSKNEIPRVLNYLTSPNVVCCSNVVDSKCSCCFCFHDWSLFIR
jgi:TAG lipase/lysophosphatidylethanolamine acyltransferase